VPVQCPEFSEPKPERKGIAPGVRKVPPKDRALTVGTSGGGSSRSHLPQAGSHAPATKSRLCRDWKRGCWPTFTQPQTHQPRQAKCLTGLMISGARDRARTGDPHVGKEMRALISLSFFA